LRLETKAITPPPLPLRGGKRVAVGLGVLVGAGVFVGDSAAVAVGGADVAVGGTGVAAGGTGVGGGAAPTQPVTRARMISVATSAM